MDEDIEDLGVAASPPGHSDEPASGLAAIAGSVPNAEHPWTFIAEEMLARGWSVEDLAIRMAVPNYDEQVREIGVSLLSLDLYRHVGPTRPNCRLGGMVPQLARAFDVSPDFFTNLENQWLAAQGMSAFGQDPQGLEAKPASPVLAEDAP